MGTKKKQRDEVAVIEDGAVHVLYAGTPIFVKTADICRMTGKSNQWIGQLTSQGTINKSKTSHGMMYDIVKTSAEYISMLEDRIASFKEPDDNEMSKLAAEAKIKQSKAIISVLEAKEVQGKMHRSEDVAEIISDLVFTMRSALLALPGRLAIDVAQTKTAAEASDLIRKEVYLIMDELAKYEYDPKKFEERVRERRKWEKLHEQAHEDD